MQLSVLMYLFCCSQSPSIYVENRKNALEYVLTRCVKIVILYLKMKIHYN